MSSQNGTSVCWCCYVCRCDHFNSQWDLTQSPGRVQNSVYYGRRCTLQTMYLLRMCEISSFMKILSNKTFSTLVVVYSLSCVQLFTTPWITACQALLSMGFSRQEYWSGLPFPPPGDLPNSGIEPRSPALQADSLPTKLQGSPSSLLISTSLTMS